MKLKRIDIKNSMKIKSGCKEKERRKTFYCELFNVGIGGRK